MAKLNPTPEQIDQMYNFIWREVDGKLDKDEILSLAQKLAKAVDLTYYDFAQKVNRAILIFVKQ